MDEELLRQLNRGKSFDQAGTVISVANVNVKPVALRANAARLEVDKTRKSVRALAADGKLLAFYPASIGSDDKPAPSGKLKVVRVARGPSYTYNPEFKFRGVKADRELKIAAGPNNPVGVGLDRAEREDLRHPRHRRARQGRQGRLARLRAHDQLGCARARRSRPQGNGGGVYRVIRCPLRPWRC